MAIPVHLTYSTAWVEEGGTVRFRDDVYRRDELPCRALFS
jgi:murein L,D-transpeptidase YcbB/YkuD